MEQPPATVEIPIRQDVMLRAVGGQGEPGRKGGNGQHGMDGMNGEDASRALDATVCIFNPILHIFGAGFGSNAE